MIEILQPGLFSSIQDQGRHGFGHLGVPSAGAVDAFNLQIANRLVGNAEAAAALEMTGSGATLRFHREASIAITGGMLDILMDGAPVAMYQTLSVPAGAEIRCGAVKRGWRSYMAVAGGIEAPPTLGSRSTDTLAGLGPPLLAAGVQLPIGKANELFQGYFRTPPRYGAPRLRILPGPQQDWFAPKSCLALRHSAYQVLPQSDRAGVRLQGPVLARTREQELPSMGMANGALQVPASGQPIALLPNHGTTGGYPVIANVIGADWHLLAQLAPGTSVHFEDVSRAEALAELRRQELRIEQDIVPADPGLLAARALMMLAGGESRLKQATVSDGQRRIRVRRSD